jgi:NAD(P)-dependent dehydrogenase (short-subunit alcohol dehydrogenase family)
MLESQNTTVVLIGAGGEIGTAIGRVLITDGFRVLTTHRNLPSEHPVDEQGHSLAYSLDVTNHQSVSDFFRHIETTFGPPFGLVYVAGCIREAPIALLSDEAWREVIDVNLTGAFACLRAVARPMMVGGRGRIVLVGSVSARIGIPGQAAYAASKAGLEGLARVAAVEFGRFGISCNVVAPGAIDSGIFRTVADAAVLKTVQRTTLRRLGTPAEVAAIVRFLLSPDAAYLTGQTVVMDGGLSGS